MVIFNIILQCSLFPDKWWFCVVVALFKKGSRLIPKNYRPVSLVLMLAKLFDFTLLDRFKKWFIPHDLQTAYQERKSSGDHIFLLRCIIQYLIKKKLKFFITAVDFDGAFDRVKRSTLLMKLVLAGASSIFKARSAFSKQLCLCVHVCMCPCVCLSVCHTFLYGKSLPLFLSDVF